jgi:hypothetical protein
METYIIGRIAKRDSISLILKQHENTKRRESMEMHKKLEEELFRDMMFSVGTIRTSIVRRHIALGLISFFTGVTVSALFYASKAGKQ